jgi:excinuclease UvrABC ATPase subunit
MGRCKTALHYLFGRLRLDPEGGDRGGTIVAVGTPEEIAKNPASVTGGVFETVIS